MRKVSLSEHNFLPVYHLKGVITGKEKLGGGYYRLRFASPEIGKIIEPGQFLHILCISSRTYPGFTPKTFNSLRSLKQRPPLKERNLIILRRPYSLHRLYEQGEIEILFKVVGRGSKLLSQRRKGDRLDLLGPLGKGFKLNPDLETALLVGGGSGIAPLYALAEKLRLQGKKVVVFIGAEDKKDIPLKLVEKRGSPDFPHILSTSYAQEFEEIGAESLVSAVKEERGCYQGMVTELLVQYLNRASLPEKVEIFACGPYPMLKEIACLSKERKIPTQVLLEERMACGVGACMGCVIKVHKKGRSGREWEYRRVCKEGPVFRGDEVFWDEN